MKPFGTWLAALMLSASICWSPHCSSQTNRIEFEHLHTGHGLSSPYVLCLYQDRTGFLWIGTAEGLNRYDGSKFVVFKSDPGDSTALYDDYVTQIHEDRSGDLWFATLGGLERYDRARRTFVRYARPGSRHQQAALNKIMRLVEDKHGQLWLATEHKGVAVFNPTNNSFTTHRHAPNISKSLSSDSIRSLLADKAGRIWIATERGLDLYHPDTGQFEHISLGQGKDSLLTQINLIAETRNGDIWFGLRNAGMARFRPERLQLELVPTRSATGTAIVPTWATAFWEDDSSHLLIGSANEGLLRLDLATKRIEQHIYSHSDPKSLSGLTARSILRDRSGILWVGTESGLNKFESRHSQLIHYDFDFHDRHYREHNDVWSIFEDASGMLWIGTNGTVRDPGLIRFNRRIPASQIVRPQRTDRFLPNVFAIRQDRSGDIWLGSYGEGVYRLDHRTRELSNICDEISTMPPNDGFVRSLALSHNGTIWIGWRTTGLMNLDHQNRSVTSYRHDPLDEHSLSTDAVICLLEDSDHQLWIGTAFGGLNRFDPALKEFKTYKRSDFDSTSISHDVVLSMYEDRTGNLWVGTAEGLNKMNRSTGRFVRFTEKDGLVGAAIYGILQDRIGNLWLSTEKALMRFNEYLPSGKKVAIIEQSDITQEIAFNKEAYFTSPGGEFFFGRNGGITSFFPEHIKENDVVPNVVLTSFKIANKEADLPVVIEECRYIEVSHSDNVLTFEFAALDFANPAKNQYAHKLEGFDRDWNHVGTRRTATYTNLDPGDYTLRAIGSNDDGTWNGEGTAVRITVHPPFWRTWWFQFIAIATFFSIGAVLYVRRIEALQRRHSMQQEFSRQLIESQEAERKRIAAELHDSVGQDLLILKNKMLMSLDPKQSTKSLRSNLGEIVKYVTKSLKNVREISRNLRPVQLDHLGLTAALEAVIETVAESSHLKTATRLDNVDNLLDKDDEINLFRIVQESLNNVLKHSGASNLTIDLKREKAELRLMIRDDGRGLDMKKPESGLGFSTMNERARILGARLHIEPNEPKGTRVLLILPLRKEHHG